MAGKNAPKTDVEPPRGDGAAAWRPKDVYWPPATRAEVDLGAPSPSPPRGSRFLAPGAGLGPKAPTADPSRAGAAPVWVAPASGKGAPRSGKASVRLADRAAAEKAGVQGLLLSVQPAAEAGPAALPGGAPVTVAVDVSHIVGAFGGDWLSRARLVSLPACALTTPERPECRTQTALPTAKDGDRPGLLRAEVALASGETAPGGRGPASAAPAADGATVLAATAAPGGSAGTYTATSLAPSGTWAHGGNTGGFSWTYPIEVPEGLGGTKPAISLSYSSQAVDGRTAATNNQASWIGEGWDYTPGFVERRFKSCSKDGQEDSGEQCLAGDNATIHFNGVSSALVRDDASGTWRLENDDASKVERLTGAANGDNNGEHWKVTTADGTQYYFGAGRKPGSGTAPVTNSAWTAPVYGNDAGEECHQSTFAASWCQQAWRWNLDFVVDPRGGVTTHWYDAETNYYKRNPTPANPKGTLTPYIRGGALNKITYGSKITDADTVKPTAQVLFTTAERCLPDANFDCAPAKLTKANAAKWPDVPFDQSCASSGTCENYAATFWTTKRLAKITTQVLNGTGGYDNVDSYALTHEFPDPLDQTAPALWLASIARTGMEGSTTLDIPPVTFGGRLMNNRVDSSGDNKPAMNRRRIVSVTAETGQVTDVAYADPDCTPGAGLPATQDGNTTRCYPVYWNPDPKSPNDPTLDWFHTYVVNRVTTLDRFGGSRPREVRYEYVGGAAWHRDDDELTETKRRTWNQFRGYEQVITRAGTAPDIVSKSAALYLRGMDGDVKADGSKRTATFSGIAGNTIKDSNPLAGSVRETRTFASDGGEMIKVSQSEPWLSGATATHGRGTGLPALTAQMLREGSTKDKALRADKTWQSTSNTTVSDTAYGVPVSVLKRADGQPDTCTTTSYARNTAAWMLDRVSETVDFQGSDCGATPTEATTLGRTRTYYDGQTLGTLTGPGQATATEELERFENGLPTYAVTATTAYDAYGRVISATDAAQAKTTTVYEPAAPARATTLKVTNAKNWTTTSTLHPLRGGPVKTVDQNNRTTEIAYDALGRTTAVWLPGRARTLSASQLFTYDLTQTGTSSVTTQTLRSNQSYATSVAIYDALGQQVQVQTVPRNGAATGRLITDTFYDSLGRAFKTNETYANADSVPVKTRFIADDNTVPSQKVTLYDGAGRPVTKTFASKAVEQWRSTIAYPGADRTDTTPPTGDTATTVLTDALGRTVERRQYRNGTPSGEYDATRYAYSVRGEATRITDASGNVWTHEYDLRGRQIRATDPDKGSSATTYDAAGRPASTTDARGVTIFTSYDVLSRPTSRNLGAANGPELATYEYDTLLPGLAAASTSWVDGKPWRQEVTGYDIGNRPTGTKLTVPAGEGALTGTYSASTSYDTITGLERRTILPAAGGLPAERLETGRNINGLPVSYGSDNIDYVNFTDYDELGRVQRTTLGDVPKQVSFTSVQDPGTGRLLRTTLDKQDATGVDITDYTYTPAGDVTSVSSRQGGVRDTQCFTYDHLRRLTRAWTDTGSTTTRPDPVTPGIGGCAAQGPVPGAVGGPAPYHQAFTYDVSGNRTTLTDHDPAGDPAKATVTTNTFPAAGRPRPHAPTSTTRQTGSGPAVSRSSTYDASGNTLTRPNTAGNDQTLTWTPEGKLASATGGSGAVSTYVYDADGNRLLRRDPGKTTLYLGTTELTLNTATNTVTGTRYYATPGGMSIVRTSEGKLAYVAPDRNGTGSTAVDAATLQVQRRASKPFGEQRGTPPTAWPGERGYVGGTQDTSTGLTHLGAREYDPRTGTFLSVDPVLVVDSSQSLHGYGYANNSPVTTSDPSGLCAEIDCATRPCPTCRNTTPGHEPRDGDDVPGSGSSGGPSQGSGSGSSYTQRPLNCALRNCGLTPPAPPTPLPRPTWLPSPLPPPPPAPPAPNCAPDDMKIECMTDIDTGDFITDPFHKMNVANGANILAHDYAAFSDSCTKRAAQYLCFGGSPGGDQSMTVGDVHFFPGDKDDFVFKLNKEKLKRAEIEAAKGPEVARKYGPDIERHEAVHSRQWASYPRAELFIANYSMASGKSWWNQPDGDPANGNRFEIGANLYWGGYKKPEER